VVAAYRRLAPFPSACERMGPRTGSRHRPQVLATGVQTTEPGHFSSNLLDPHEGSRPKAPAQVQGVQVEGAGDRQCVPAICSAYFKGKGASGRVGIKGAMSRSEFDDT
jgi:hypothetical protein